MASSGDGAAADPTHKIQTNKHTQAFVNPLSALRAAARASSSPLPDGSRRRSSRILPLLQSTMSPSDTSAAAAASDDNGDGWDFAGAPWPDQIDYEDLEDKGAAALKAAALPLWQQVCRCVFLVLSVSIGKRAQGKTGDDRAVYHHATRVRVQGRQRPRRRSTINNNTCTITGRDEARVPRGEDAAGLLDALGGMLRGFVFERVCLRS